MTGGPLRRLQQLATGFRTQTDPFASGEGGESGGAAGQSAIDTGTMTGGPLRRLQQLATGFRTQTDPFASGEGGESGGAAGQSAIDTGTMTGGPLRRLQQLATGFRTQTDPFASGEGGESSRPPVREQCAVLSNGAHPEGCVSGFEAMTVAFGLAPGHIGVDRGGNHSRGE